MEQPGEAAETLGCRFQRILKRHDSKGGDPGSVAIVTHKRGPTAVRILNSQNKIVRPRHQWRLRGSKCKKRETRGLEGRLC